MNLRMATVEDAPALVRIYAQSIGTPITFEYELPSVRAFAQRISDTLEGYPYLVCEEAGEAIGYAYAHRHQERAAYQWNAELSVYLDRTHLSKGLGTKLYQALIELLLLQNVKTVYGCVTIPNEKSEALHASMGFRRIGTFRSTGYKNGSWRDVCWFEKQIAPYENEPQPLRLLPTVPAQAVKAILERFSEETHFHG